MLFRVCFLVALVSVNAHQGPRVPSCTGEGNLPAERSTGTFSTGAFSTGALSAERSTFDDQGALSPNFGGVKGGQQKLVQEPIIQEPIVQQHFVQEPIVQEPLQQKLVQEPLTQEPVQEPVQEPIQQKEVFPVKGQQQVMQEPVWSTEAPLRVQQHIQEPLVQEPFYQEPVVREPIVQSQQQEEVAESALSPSFGSYNTQSLPMSRGAQLLNLPNGIDNILPGISTTFSCWGRAYGYFADIENNCQVFHICHQVLNAEGVYEMTRNSFFCPENTIFDQIKHTCYPIDDALPCAQAISYYPHTEQRFAAPVMYHAAASQPAPTFEHAASRSFGTYGTKGGSLTTTYTRSNPLPLPMMSNYENLPSKTNMRIDYPVKGGPVMRAAVKGREEPITESYPVKGQLRTEITTESYPVKGQMRTEIITEAYPVKGQVRAEIKGQVRAEIPETYPVKGQVRAEIPENYPVKGLEPQRLEPSTLAPELPIKGQRLLPVKGETRTETFKGHFNQPTYNTQRLAQPHLIQPLPFPSQKLSSLPLSPSRALNLHKN